MGRLWARHATRLGAILLLFAGLLTFPVRAGGVPSLRGHNVIRTDSLGHVVFHVPRSIDFGRDFHIALEGSGRIYGYVFWKAGEMVESTPSVQEVEFSNCAARACREKRVFDAEPLALGFEDEIPAGDYEMYVFADGNDVTVTITVDTLSGQRRFTPTPVAGEVVTPTGRVDATAPYLYSAGDFTKFEKPTLAIVGLWATSAPHVFTAIGDCEYYGRRLESSPTVAFTPGCPMGASAIIDSRNLQGDEGGASLTVMNWAGPVGLGGWFTTSLQPARWGAVALWIK